MFRYFVLFPIILSFFSIDCFANSYNDISITFPVKSDLSKPFEKLPHSKKILESNHTITINNANSITLTAFKGLGKSLNNYTIKSDVPNTTGSVGMNQYIQLINKDVAIFNKTTGALYSGFPKSINFLWAGFGGLCETQDDGSPTMKYDQLAHRWVFTKKAFGDWVEGPFLICIAISKTEDATGAYYRFAYSFDSIPDEGKLGLGSNAYFLSFNMQGPSVYGTRFCAIDRTKLLAGTAGSMQCRQLNYSISNVPADLDGYNIPATGSPGYYIGNVNNYVGLYQYKIDFDNNKNSELIGPIYLDYIGPVGTVNRGAEQPNTDTTLNGQSGNIMYRVVYRQFDNYGSLLVNASVPGYASWHYPFGQYWIEYRIDNNLNINGYQGQFYFPDSKSRYIGSIGMDKAGNIALAYTVSSSAVYPSLELSWRRNNDPLSQLTNLQPLWTGSGSQTGSSAWGNHSSLAMDPADDCTFWYTNEYLEQTALAKNWSTVIIHFKLTNCDNPKSMPL
jgi:hypothetical protein